MRLEDERGCSARNTLGDEAAQPLGARARVEQAVTNEGHQLAQLPARELQRSLEQRVDPLEQGLDGVMVALNEPNVEFVSLADAVGALRTVPMDCDTLIAARELGISFGDG